MREMRFLSGVLALTWMAGALPAQNPTVAEQEAQRARKLLASPQWVEKAWGVYLSAALRGPDLNDILVEQFRMAEPLRNATHWMDERAFVDVVFDAAIDSGANIPTGLLEPFLENRTIPTLILLARNKDSDEALLGLTTEKSSQYVWLAANNLLFERKSQRWYTELLGQIRITQSFTVADPHAMVGSGGGVGATCVGDGIDQAPKGFPPVARYTLDIHDSEAGNVVLAAGPINSYYQRTLVPSDRQVGLSTHDCGVDRMAVRLGYLAKLAVRRQDHVQENFQRKTTVYFTTSEAFAKEVNRQMRSQEQSIREIFGDVERSGLKAPEIEWTVVPEIDDQRSDKSVPLPPVVPWVIHMKPAETVLE